MLEQNDTRRGAKIQDLLRLPRAEALRARAEILARKPYARVRKYLITSCF